jgi:hypothetical protein
MISRVMESFIHVYKEQIVLNINIKNRSTDLSRLYNDGLTLGDIMFLLVNIFTGRLDFFVNRNKESIFQNLFLDKNILFDKWSYLDRVNNIGIGLTCDIDFKIS